MVRGAARRSESEAEGVWVALETSTSAGSVAVWKDGLVYEETQRIVGVHSERVLPAVARALDAVGVGAADVTDLVVGSGPGSFTGVRIAASLAKGWVAGNKCSLFAYSSLLASAAGCGPGQVCALFDARREEVYGACFEIDSDGYKARIEPGVWAIGDLLRMLESRQLSPAFAGEGAILHRGAISRVFGPQVVLAEHLGLPRAASLLWLRKVAAEAGRVERPRGWIPLYVRDWRVSEKTG